MISKRKKYVLGNETSDITIRNTTTFMIESNSYFSSWYLKVDRILFAMTTECAGSLW